MQQRRAATTLLACTPGMAHSRIRTAAAASCRPEHEHAYTHALALLPAARRADKGDQLSAAGGISADEVRAGYPATHGSAQQVTAEAASDKKFTA